MELTFYFFKDFWCPSLVQDLDKKIRDDMQCLYVFLKALGTLWLSKSTHFREIQKRSNYVLAFREQPRLVNRFAVISLWFVNKKHDQKHGHENMATIRFYWRITGAWWANICLLSFQIYNCETYVDFRRQGILDESHREIHIFAGNTRFRQRGIFGQRLGDI